MSNSSTGFMETKNIAHLTGKMDAILKMIEFNAKKVVCDEYLKKSLMSMINEAKDVNEKIFEIYKKNELEKIKKTYSNEGDGNK